MTSVGEVMSTKLISVEPSATVAEAATVMGERHVGSALVMDGDDLVGIFTERDVLRALSQDFDAPSHEVSDWMTKDPITVPPDMAIDAAMELMLSGGFRHLPVTRDGVLVGMVSMRDLARALGDDSAPDD